MGFPGGSVVKKKSPPNAGDIGDVSLIRGSGRSPGEGKTIFYLKKTEHNTHFTEFWEN